MVLSSGAFEMLRVYDESGSQNAELTILKGRQECS
jgi:hypothetical protein